MKILTLGGGLLQLPLIEELLKRRYEVVVADYAEEPLAKRVFADALAPSGLLRFALVSSMDAPAVAELAKREKVDFTATMCVDRPLTVVAYVADHTDVPCFYSRESIRAVADKTEMKRGLVDAGVPTARFTTVDAANRDAARDFAREIGYPVVVKPTDGNGSRGVVKVANEAELETALDVALQTSRRATAILEKFVAGTEISVDAFVSNGVARVLLATESVKSQTNAQNFTIVGSKYPSDALSDPKIGAEIEKICNEIARAFKIQNGPLIVQTLVGPDGVFVVEFGVRMGGGSKVELIRRLTGVDTTAAYVDFLVGKKPAPVPRKTVEFAYFKYLYCRPGTIREIVGFDDLEARNVVDFAFVRKAPGDVVERAVSSGDRLGGILITANTRDELDRKFADAEKTLRVSSETEENILIF